MDYFESFDTAVSEPIPSFDAYEFFDWEINTGSDFGPLPVMGWDSDMDGSVNWGTIESPAIGWDSDMDGSVNWGTIETTVEPPAISWGGEEVYTMDRPPYEYGAPTVQRVDTPEPTPAPPPVVAPAPAPGPAPSVAEVAQVVKTISGAAMAAIGVVKAWEDRRLTPNPVARATRPNGTVVTARSNGTVVSRDTQGRVTVTRPEVGLPQATEDGFVVINNGDNTYTRINARGQRETIRYPGGSTVSAAAGSGVSPGLLLALGAGAVALIALRK